MPTIRLRGRRFINGTAARASETQGALRRETREIEGKARANLSKARASGTEKISGPEHVTRVTSSSAEGKYGSIDYMVHLEGTDPMAIEFGHFPSGYFAPERYGRVTKSPHGLYILSRAAGLVGSHSVSSGRKRGKR